MSSSSQIPQKLLQTPFVDPKTGILTSFAATNFISRLLAPAKIPQLVINTHANRMNLIASKYPSGSLFFETDRGVFYISKTSVWVYLLGIMQSAQIGLPKDLGANDVGFLINVTDFAHLLQWNGSAWTWGPGDGGSGYTIPFVGIPGTGWQIADGSVNVPQLNPDGTISYVTVPNTAGSYFRQ